MMKSVLSGYLELLKRWIKLPFEKRPDLTTKAARKANRYYWLGILHLNDEAVVLTTRLTEKLPGVRRLFLNFLAERVIQGALHANFLHREYTYSSHADIAGINRGMIEASVNYFYLLDDSGCQRLAAFWAKSAHEEFTRNNGLKKWIHDDDELLKHFAQCDYSPNYPTLEQMLKNISEYTGVNAPNCHMWPNFKQRCTALGKTWQMIYDMEYKAMSTWQHGDPSRVIISPSYARLDPSQKDRNVFESLVLANWAFTLLYMFVRELAIRCDDKTKIEELKHMFWAVHWHVDVIIAKHAERYQPNKYIRASNPNRG